MKKREKKEIERKETTLPYLDEGKKWERKI